MSKTKSVHKTRDLTNFFFPSDERFELQDTGISNQMVYISSTFISLKIPSNFINFFYCFFYHKSNFKSPLQENLKAGIPKTSLGRTTTPLQSQLVGHSGPRALGGTEVI